MENEMFEYVKERVEKLSQAGSSTQVTKDAALEWLKTVEEKGQEAAHEATDKLLDVIEGRPTKIDEVIDFAKTKAADLMGEDGAKKMLEEQTQRLKDGAKWCNCEACEAATDLLAKFERIEK